MLSRVGSAKIGTTRPPNGAEEETDSVFGDTVIRFALRKGNAVLASVHTLARDLTLVTSQGPRRTNMKNTYWDSNEAFNLSFAECFECRHVDVLLSEIEYKT